MFGNIKSITLKDGTTVDLSTRVGEYFEVPIDDDSVEMVHQDAFFKDRIGEPDLLAMLLEKEESYKRSEAGRKAAETRKKNKAKRQAEKEAAKNSKNEDIYSEENLEDANHAAEASINESIELQNKQEESEETQSNEDIVAEEVDDIQDVVDNALKDEARAEPEEAIEVEGVEFEDDFDDEPDTENMSDEEVDEMISEDANSTPQFEKPSIQALFDTLADLNDDSFGNVAKDKYLFIAALDSNGIIEKVGEWSGCDKACQMLLKQDDVAVYDVVKEATGVNADVHFVMPAVKHTWATIKDIVKAMKKGSVFYGVVASTMIDESAPFYTDYQELIKKGHDETIVDVENEAFSIIVLKKK